MSAVDAPTEEAVAVPRVLQRIERKDRPIIVGPWVSEVGFELLYWIPFLNWVTTHRPFSADRLVVVSRGGCAAWYRDIATHYVELFDYYTPDEFRQRSEQRSDRRQGEATDDVGVRPEHDQAGAAGIASPAVRPAPPDVHVPAVSQVLAEPRIGGHGRELRGFQAAAASRDERARGQAARTTSWRFASTSTTSFRTRRRTGEFVASLLNALAETTDVVLLNPSMRLDDRVDVPVTARGRIHDISDLMSPRTNLDIQSKVIARARAFVGTHGGLSYLPPLYGVKSLSFYSDPRPSTVRHLELARRAFNRMHPARTSRSTSTTSTRCATRWANSTRRSQDSRACACSDCEARVRLARQCR